MDFFYEYLTLKPNENTEFSVKSDLQEEEQRISTETKYVNPSNVQNVLKIPVLYARSIKTIPKGSIIIRPERNNSKVLVSNRDTKEKKPSLLATAKDQLQEHKRFPIVSSSPMISSIKTELRSPIIINSKDRKPINNIIKIVPVRNTEVQERKRHHPMSVNDQLPEIKRMNTELSKDIIPRVCTNLTQINKPNSGVAYDLGLKNSEFGQLTYSEAYSNYESARLKIGSDHPNEVVESKSLSTVQGPAINYQLKIPRIVINKGILSKVQLEAVVYACQKHEEHLNDGRRAGFLIGDGAGIGKGRTVAGIIYENYLRGRKKALWISVSKDLKEDAKRDLKDIGREIGHEIKIRSLKKMSYLKVDSKANGRFNDGVLFLTYSSLISNCKRPMTKYFKSRFDQIIQWFGRNYDGVIVFDECHKAKNVYHGRQTKTGTLVKRLQDILQESRVVYASATGASEPKHMVYMVRLGLWGPGKPFTKFEDFESTLTKHGVGAMELIAMEMKEKGMYLARQLSFENIKFEIKETKYENLKINGHKFEDVYNKCVELWNHIFQVFQRAYRRNKIHFQKEESMFQAQFWAAHQRFFRCLCISSKIEDCVQIAMEKIEEGKCIVIGLQSTGESSLNNVLEENCGELSDYVSNAKTILKNMIKTQFPSMKNLRRLQEKRLLKSISFWKKNEDNKTVNEEKNYKAMGKNPNDEDSEFSSSECSDSDMEDAVKEFEYPDSYQSNVEDDQNIFSEDNIDLNNLLQRVEEMSDMFPPNVLDQLIQEFGGPDFVAELTGRKGRMVEVDGKIVYQPRREGDIDLDLINLLEKDRFNNGQKIVAIISDAASTGISLHSDKKFTNQSERFHITLELPWSADKAIQQFGRTHRSNQVNQPHYLFLISDLAGERRFAATVAKRLESLGALTHGDRRCGETQDLSQFNFDTKFGARALKKLVDNINNIKKPLPPYPETHMKNFDNDSENFRRASLKALKSVGMEDHRDLSVTKFLNRLLGIEINIQNALFQYFLDLMEVEINNAKRYNQFDHGIRDLTSDNDNIFRDEPEIIHINPVDYIKIHKVTNIFPGVSWEEAEKMYLKNPDENFFLIIKEKNITILGLVICEKDETFRLITPNFAEKMIDLATLSQKYQKLAFEVGRASWEYCYSRSMQQCHHLICLNKCEVGDSCNFGKRYKTNYIMTGSTFLAWKKINRVYDMVHMDIVRVKFNDNTKLVGSLMSPKWWRQVKKIFIKD